MVPIIYNGFISKIGNYVIKILTTNFEKWAQMYYNLILFLLSKVTLKSIWLNFIVFDFSQ